MILRRFMQHVKDQNWFAVGLDVLVVITGIFLGMQVTDWNEARKDRIHVERMLDMMSVETEIILSNSRQALAFHQQRVEDLLFIIDVARAGRIDEESKDRFLTAIAIADAHRSSVSLPNSFRDLDAAGMTSLIENEHLRSLLMEFRREVEVVEGTFQQVRSVITASSVAFKRYARVSTDIIPIDEPSYREAIRTLESYDFEGMWQDPEFVVAAQEVYRMQLYFYSNHAAIGALLNEIRVELGAPK